MLRDAKKRVADNEMLRPERQENLPHRQPQGTPFMGGEQVLRRTPSSYDGRTVKLAREWQGPYRIAEVIDSVTVRLYNPTTREPDTTPINVSQLKRFIDYKQDNQPPEQEPPPEEIQTGDSFEIDRILEHSIGRDGKRQYKVRWRG